MLGHIAADLSLLSTVVSEWHSLSDKGSPQDTKDTYNPRDMAKCDSLKMAGALTENSLLCYFVYIVCNGMRKWWKNLFRLCCEMNCKLIKLNFERINV